MRRAVLLAVLAGSCAPAPAPARPLREFRGIVHCHTLYSHDSRGTYEEILAAARAARIDFVCITDHPPKGDAGRSLREGWRGMREGVLFIQGHELAGSNLLALGIREPVPSGSIPERIAAIRRQGGVALVSHPEEVRDWETYRQADGMEIYNVHAAWKRRQGDLGFYAQALRMLKEDPERIFRLLQQLDPEVQARWEEAARGRSFAAVAGNDAHQNVRLGGLQVDPYERSFRFVSTHVWAEDRTEESILEAIRRGRCHVAFAAEGPPPEPPGGPVPRVIERGGRPWLVFGGEPRRCDLDWPRPMQ
ncbi:MAG TPA: hypothetical protein VNO22_07380 [Planctomycetota bacterium]|nr:hypothetical protein [Planctomycetota bacterium]